MVWPRHHLDHQLEPVVVTWQNLPCTLLKKLIYYHNNKCIYAYNAVLYPDNEKDIWKVNSTIDIMKKDR